MESGFCVEKENGRASSSVAPADGTVLAQYGVHPMGILDFVSSVDCNRDLE